jgi:hypothetical protein
MEAAVRAEIGRLRWRVWSGKEWGRARGLLTTGLWPLVGGGAPAAGRLAAHREHGRGGLCSGELPAWDELRVARWVPVGLGRLWIGVGLRRYWPEGAAPRQRALAGRQALRLARCWPMRGLYRQGAAMGRPA